MTVPSARRKEMKLERKCWEREEGKKEGRKAGREGEGTKEKINKKAGTNIN